jgi:hypothetical protein
MSALDSGLGQIGVVKGSVTMKSGGWVPKLPDGLVVGIRVSITSGSTDTAAKLAVSVMDPNGVLHPVDVALSAAGQKAALWFFSAGAAFSSSGPSMLVFPGGETVDLGVLSAS